ncbi:hypothetical protein Droror1_Dr00010357 [Drosera rotundifolia]
MRNPKLHQIRVLPFSSLQPNQSQTPQIFPPTHEYLSHTTSTTLSSSLQHFINSGSPFHGLKIHSHVLKIGFKPNTNISIKLLILHLKGGSVNYAHKVFDEMCKRTLTAYNYLLNGYVKEGKVMESFDLVRRMCYCNEKPDGFTLSLVLKVCAGGSGGWSTLMGDVGRQVHAYVVKCVVDGDVVLFASLIDSYVKRRRVEFARRVYDRMLVKNVMCSTSLIHGYFNEDYVETAEEIFVTTDQKDVVVFNAMIEGYSKFMETAKKSIQMYIEMQRLGFHPTISTFASVIGACSMLVAPQIGQQVQAQIIKVLFSMEVKIGSALVDMYSKCGHTDDALRVFDHMPDKNVFSWTSLMDGYGKNGNPREAIAIFDRMRREHQTAPNNVTFLSALSACGHAGLVDEGWEIFNSMERDYSIKPGMEHYACMVDLLGRYGSINQAWEFIKVMPETPNSDVWVALLSSCRLHGEVKIANLAADELLKLQINERPGAYVTLSNTLAEAGKWENLRDVRDLMRSRGVSKGAGSSWAVSDDT